MDLKNVTEVGKAVGKGAVQFVKNHKSEIAVGTVTAGAGAAVGYKNGKNKGYKEGLEKASALYEKKFKKQSEDFYMKSSLTEQDLKKMRVLLDKYEKEIEKLELKVEKDEMEIEYLKILVENRDRLKKFA